MTTKWAKCIKCQRTFRIPLDYSDEGQICEDCEKPANWQPPKIIPMRLPIPNKSEKKSFWEN